VAKSVRHSIPEALFYCKHFWHQTSIHIICLVLMNITMTFTKLHI
jgi:hypothetical protein